MIPPGTAPVLLLELDVGVEVDAEDDVDADVDVDVDVNVAEGGAIESGPPGTCRSSVNNSTFALTLVRRTSTSRRSDIKIIVLRSWVGYWLEAS